MAADSFVTKEVCSFSIVASAVEDPLGRIDLGSNVDELFVSYLKSAIEEC